MSGRLVVITMLAGLFGALTGCAADEQLAPLGAGAADAGPADASADAAPLPPPVDAGLVKRTVMMRNPVGGPAGNHLIDGDFEFSTTPYGGQLGWRGFSGDGSQEIVVATETGGLCRSGLRCAVMKPSMLFLLRGTSAKGKGNVISGWAKPAEGSSCSVVRPVLIDCDTFVVLKQVPGKKDGDEGWCHYTSAIGERDTATCLYIDSAVKKDTVALVDAFVLGPDDGTVHPLEAEFWAPEAEMVGRLENLRRLVISTTPFGKAERRAAPKP